MATYPKIDLKKVRGSPFCMAFVYHKSGPKVYTGDLHTINTHLKSEALCHGMVTIRSRNNRIVYPMVFGGGGRTYDLISAQDAFEFRRSYVDRRKWDLIYRQHKPYRLYIIRSWRKLPKTFLREFEEFKLFIYGRQDETVD